MQDRCVACYNTNGEQYNIRLYADSLFRSNRVACRCYIVYYNGRKFQCNDICRCWRNFYLAIGNNPLQQIPIIALLSKLLVLVLLGCKPWLLVILVIEYSCQEEQLLKKQLVMVDQGLSPESPAVTMYNLCVRISYIF